MSNLLLYRNEKGMGLPEVLIATMITMVGILALLSVQSPTIRLVARSDFTGRAVGILQKTMETREGWIMNPCNIVTVGTVAENVRVSGMTTNQSGDVIYTVNTTTTAQANGTWLISVRVTWPGNTVGLTESMIVSRQEYFRQGGC